MFCFFHGQEHDRNDGTIRTQFVFLFQCQTPHVFFNKLKVNSYFRVIDLNTMLALETTCVLDGIGHV